MRGHRAIDDAPKVGSNLVRAAFLACVAGRAFLEYGFARSGVGAGQKGRDGNGRRRFGTGSSRLSALRRRNGETRRLRKVGGEYRARNEIDRENRKRDAQERTEQFVDFKRIHTPKAPSAAGPTKPLLCPATVTVPSQGRPVKSRGN